MDAKALVEQYRQLVLEYEQLNQAVNALLTSNNGGTENISAEDLQHYRDLANQRDEAHNRMKTLEQQLFNEDSELDND